MLLGVYHSILQSATTQVQYFHKRVALMQYPQYQRDGWPIGSGIVESANKVVVQARWQQERACIGLLLMSIQC
jgi:hypothetical protein